MHFSPSADKRECVVDAGLIGKHEEMQDRIMNERAATSDTITKLRIETNNLWWSRVEQC